MLNSKCHISLLKLKFYYYFILDRDINQIWRELQELEKLPNGGYRPRSTPPYATVSSPNRTSSATPTKATHIQPVKVKASYVAKPISLTPQTQRRTIWDYDETNKKQSTPPPPLRQNLPPPPPLPPHLRPSHQQPPKSVTIAAPIARDESFYDLGSKSPSVASAYDNEYSPNSGNFKGFPYIDGAPPSRKRPQKAEVISEAVSVEADAKEKSDNNFALLVDKSTQTPEEKLQRKAKDACAIL